MVSEVSRDAIASRGWAEAERLSRRVAALEAEIADMRQARRVAVEIEASRAALRDSEARYRLVVESATDYAIFTMDLARRITGWNVGAERVLGWAEAEVVGQPADVIFTPEDREAGAPEQEARGAVEEGRAEDVRWHLKRDGSRLWANGVMLPLRDDAGSIQGLLKILRDKTAEKRAGDELREQAGFLQSVLASSGDCIKVLDLDGRLVFMSEGGQRVMEVSDYNAIRGCPWPDFWQGQGNADARAAVDAAKAGGAGHFQGAANTMAGTPRYWDVQVTPILGADGRPEKLLSVSRDITATRNAEKAMRESETRWRGLFERLHEGLVLGELVRDADGRTVDWRCRDVNPAWEDMVGIPREEALGRTVREIIPGIEAEWVDGFALVVETGEPATFMRQVGTFGRWYEGHVFRLEAGRFAALFFEVTKRQQGEARRAALLELGDRLRDMDDVTEMLLVAARIMGRILGVSAAGYGTMAPDGETATIERGWTAAGTRSIAGRHRMRDYGSHVEDLRRGEAAVIADVKQDPRTVAAATALAALGAGAFVNLPLIEHGRLVALFFVLDARPRSWTAEDVGFARDVAERTRVAVERRRAENSLRDLAASLERKVGERTAERNLLAKIVETTDVMIMVSDLDYNILAINGANADEFERIYGVRPKVGDNMLGVLADQPAHQAQVRAGWGRGLAGEEITIVEDYGDPDRVRPYYEVKFRSLWDDQGKRVGCYQFVTDVTERLGEQAKLAEAQETLRQAQKMEAVGQLTGGLAHDFNNLLAGISGSLELLQTRVAQGRIGDLDRYITAAQGASKRAAALTHRLLAFTRRQTLDPKPTNINRLVAGMEELIRRTVGPAVAVEAAAAGGLWTTLVDPNQLENALLNLCINARDAMPDGGRLTVETGNRWLDQRAARERELPPGQYVSLCVSDTGTGMTPEVVRRAFDPFFTTKPIGMGMGLGLSMIYGFVRQSGGQARIYSEVGQGAMVCLYLPRHHGEAEDADMPVELAAAPRAGDGETVLVVDDEPTVRMLVTEVLEDLGYTAIEAADSAAGLKVLQSDVRIDLLVTDVGLPGGMNGRQVADAGRAARPGLKVLFITGYAENAVLSHGHLGPGMHVLTKPFAMEALAGRIKELIIAR